IKQGLDKAYKEAGHNAYFGNGFEAGVKYAQEQFKILNIPCVMPSAFEKLTDKELEEAEHSKLSEIAGLHKQWKAILNEQFYRKHPECKPH
ncbi:MAG: hypothetical protein ACXAC7_22980, partial [Candidatus Hodarchaeales archaeon]